jgi:hypothetical protein
VRERAGGQQGGGGLGDQPAGDALAAADGDRGVDLRAARGGRQVVGDVEPDGAVRGEREPAGLGLVDLDLEADAAAGQPPGDAGTGAGDEARRVEVVDLERERRPAGHRVGVGEHVEDRRGLGVDGGRGGPGLHAAEPCHRAAPVSSAWQMILPGPLDDPASSSRMTRDP